MNMVWMNGYLTNSLHMSLYYFIVDKLNSCCFNYVSGYMSTIFTERS